MIMSELAQEIAAMTTIGETIEKIEDEKTRLRVLKWAVEKFGQARANVSTGGAFRASPAPSLLQGDEGEVVESIGRLFEIAHPSSNPERVLVASYWYQEYLNEVDISAQSIHDELKQMGYPVPNITSTFNLLMNRTPALARQVRKSGKSKQARKKYTLTDAGKAAVKVMLTGASMSISDEPS
jgi:hypothetical protein